MVRAMLARVERWKFSAHTHPLTRRLNKEKLNNLHRFIFVDKLNRQPVLKLRRNTEIFQKAVYNKTEKESYKK